jgi:thiamine-phosphate pyrophosphorylase
MEKRRYRIIDANFNRASEAVRTIEEFCRFVLDCENLSAQAKQLRHKLSGIIKKTDYQKLIAARDTLGDVGVEQKVNSQMQRDDFYDCIRAAFRRFTEALRVLSEVFQTIDKPSAAEIEKLRYRAYSFEKQITEFSEPLLRFSKAQLYIVITNHLPAEVIRLTRACARGGADCVQLRAKDIEDDKLYALAKEFVKICSDSGILSIINDRADIAISAGADGVHLGQTDLPVSQVRRMQLKPMIIGKSTHSMQQLKKAADEKPTYAALGPVFPTQTKPSAAAVGLEYVEKGVKFLDEKNICHTAIGNINLETADAVLKAGAKSLAVCSAVCNAQNPSQMCRKLKDKIKQFSY